VGHGLLFKKPWTISPKAEFMLGIGPEWVYLGQNGKTTNSIAGEVLVTSCSGRPTSTALADFSNPLTTTALHGAINNQSA
jgi:hypothetical protein